MARVLALIATMLWLAVPAAAQIRTQLVATGFSEPVEVVQDPTQSNVLFVVQQGGRIRPVVDGVIAADFLNLTGIVLNSGEQGLLGLAFAPDYATSRRFFVNFVNTNGDTVIARFLRSATNPLEADPSSRFDLVWPDGNAFITQPFANHNGGHLEFGPDGFLYIGMGDGGSGGDPFNHAQNPQSLLGKFLRIDVAVAANHPAGYVVPAGNPFVGVTGILPEIWSFGLRNPWRWSFDPPSRGGTGALVIGDVGQNAWEEIDYEPPATGGRNYGWRNREGAHDFNGSVAPFSLPLIEPIHEYSHAVGSSVTGGQVYRGMELGLQFAGRYFFADFISSRVFSVELTINPTTGEATAGTLLEHTSQLGTAAQNVSSFGVDAQGELLIVSYTGSVHRIIPSGIRNGTFTAGLQGWLTWATPAPAFFVGGVSGGVAQFFRQAAPAGTANQAVLFQPTGLSTPALTPIAARADFGNSSTVRKRLSIVLHDLDFSDLAVCTFWLAPGTPLRTYEMYARTTRPWSNLTMSFYAATEGSDGGFYQIDNVVLELNTTASSPRTECVDPTSPSAIPAADGPNLIANGSFDTDTAAWFQYGQIEAAISAGVLQASRPPGDPAGVIVQATGTSLPAGAVVTATFDLGNASSDRRRVTVLLHDLDFSDLAACTFWLPPGQPLETYTMRAFATRPWARTTISFYPVTIDLASWMRLDNVTLRQTPSLAIAGTECLEPGSFGPIAGASAMLAPPCASTDHLPSSSCSWLPRRRSSGHSRRQSHRLRRRTSTRSPRC